MWNANRTGIRVNFPRTGRRDGTLRDRMRQPRKGSVLLVCRRGRRGCLASLPRRSGQRRGGPASRFGQLTAALLPWRSTDRPGSPPLLGRGRACQGRAACDMLDQTDVRSSGLREVKKLCPFCRPPQRDREGVRDAPSMPSLGSQPQPTGPLLGVPSSRLVPGVDLMAQLTRLWLVTPMAVQVFWWQPCAHSWFRSLFLPVHVERLRNAHLFHGEVWSW